MIRRVLRSSLAVSVAAYALGICLVGTVAALGAYRVVTTVVPDLRAPDRGTGPATPQQADVARKAPSTASGADSREIAMSPARKGGFQSSVVHPAYVGRSSRWGRRSYRYRYEDPDDYEDYESDYDDNNWAGYRRSGGTYRTLCVRLCDGYYFPVSFSATRSRFDDDAKVCERKCPGQARLFVHPNPGADVEDMVDLRGEQYRQLKTAFLYRTEYVPSCKCKPDPWDAEARQRHRMYALEAAARKGDKQARAELAELAATMKRDAPDVAAKIAPAKAASRPDVADTSLNVRRRSSESEDRERMGLGARPAREAERSSPRRADPDWMARALGRQ